MNENIPDIVLLEMKRCGLNSAFKSEHDGRVFYSLYQTDSEGRIEPTGLPYMVEVTNDGLRKLEPKEYFEM